MLAGCLEGGVDRDADDEAGSISAQTDRQAAESGDRVEAAIGPALLISLHVPNYTFLHVTKARERPATTTTSQGTEVYYSLSPIMASGGDARLEMSTTIIVSSCN